MSQPLSNGHISDSDASSITSNESETGWESIGGTDSGEDTQCVDLFSPQTFPTAADVFSHAKSEHGFEFQEVVKDLGG